MGNCACVADVSRQHSVSVSPWNFPGFSVVLVPTDGNCLFASIAHQLQVLGINQTQRTAGSVRHELVEYIRQSADMHDIIRAGLDAEVNDSLENYLSTMYKDGTWGDGNMLAAACRLYGVRINIYREDNAIPVVICNTVSDSNGRLMNIAFVGESRGKEPIHYISLVPSCHTISSDTLTTTHTVDAGLQQHLATQSSTPSPTIDSETSDSSVRTAANTENYR